MAQHLKIESIGSIGSIILAILEVQVIRGPTWGCLEPHLPGPARKASRRSRQPAHGVH